MQPTESGHKRLVTKIPHMPPAIAEVAQAHLAAGADNQIEIRQIAGCTYAIQAFFVHLKMIQSAIARRAFTMDLQASTISERDPY